VRVAGLVAELRRRWQSGERVLVEKYLEQQPTLQADPEAVVDLIYNEVLLREEGGETPSLAEYVQRFPHLAEALAVQFEVDQGFRADLLAGQPAANDPCATRTAGAVPVATAALWPAPPGYEVLGELGRGGMGVVYKARQSKLNRIVALKMILAGSHAQAADLERFRVEEESIARLQHPHIVQIYEVGEYEGNPFFSLEFCPGGSLQEKLAGTPLPPGEAALVVEKLARAMAAAHAKGVIHRDLKPANVLLGEDGTLKITDFGLAKKLDEAGQTATGTVMGTPSYMAPEQAQGKKAVGPAADVYALGAILYECLTGRPPFKGATLHETILQVVTEEPVAPRSLQPRVPGDLETICLKCLHKDPHKRYSSAGELGDELACYLAGRPIQARPVGPWERAWKWARRRPAFASMLSVSVAALLVLLVGGWWSYRREAAQRQRAEDKLRDALEVVDQLLTEVAEVDLVDVPQMERVRKRLLRRAQRYYEKFLAENPNDPTVRREAGRARVRLGDIQEMLGETAEAEASYQRALSLLGQLHTTFPDVAVYRQDLARAHHGLAVLWRKTGKLAEAERAGREALRLRRQLADDHPDEPAYQRDLADSSYQQGALLARLPGRQRDAEGAYRASLERQRRLVARFPDRPDYRRDLARTLNNQGILLQANGRSEAEEAITEAARLQHELVKRFPKVPGYRRELARYHTNLGMQRSRRSPRQAERSYDAARALLAALAADFPTVPAYRQELAAVHSNRGLLFQSAGRWREAEAAFGKALALRRELTELPDDRHKLADTLVKWGYLVAGLGRADAAEAAYREALAIQDSLAARPDAVAAYHSARGSTLNHQARLLVERGTFAERRQLLELFVRTAWGTPLHSLEPVLAARAALAEARRCLDQAIREHAHALRAEPNNALYRRYLCNDHFLQVVVLLRLADHGAAAVHAEELPRLFPAGRDEYLHAARFLARAAALAERDGRLPPGRRRELVQKYSRRAAQLLRQANARGRN
jgi:tetratricopeptide (TPR) repeat protein/tRNA A-37 threonylcarbamoyl transferase component Bud32